MKKTLNQLLAEKAHNHINDHLTLCYLPDAKQQAAYCEGYRQGIRDAQGIITDAARATFKEAAEEAIPTCLETLAQSDGALRCSCGVITKDGGSCAECQVTAAESREDR